MRAKFLGVEANDFVNKNTGEKGTEHTLGLLEQPGGVRMVRVSEELYTKLRNLPMEADVTVEFGFAAGKFGRFFPTVIGLSPVSKVQ